MSSVAAVSLARATSDGFTAALLVAGIAAFVAAGLAAVITPRPPNDQSPCRGCSTAQLLPDTVEG